MKIASGTLSASALTDTVVLVTGAGGGIGFEAARSLLWLGASVVIAEIDEAAGRDAARRLEAEWPAGRILFVPADVADEKSVRRLAEKVESTFGKVDVVLNNATFAPVGAAVTETPIEAWDRSYGVNLRGPVLLAGTFVPGMIARRKGVFVCVSSTGGPYLGAYETLKAAQLELANTLDAELAGTGLIAFTIGPGLVPTETARAAIEKLAPRLGTTVPEFWAAQSAAVLSVEEAGAGFAAAIALAERYGGQEISSSQALIDAGIALASTPELPNGNHPVVGDPRDSVEACRRVRATLADQVAGWKERSFFERQWMQRDFKQHVGMPAERCLEMLDQVEKRMTGGDAAALHAQSATFGKLAQFYEHLGELARGYVKDPKQREEQLRLIEGWRTDVERLVQPTTTPV